MQKTSKKELIEQILLHNPCTPYPHIAQIVRLPESVVERIIGCIKTERQKHGMDLA